MTITNVHELIKTHEGWKNKAYPDSLGKWTVGVGHCLETKPLSDAAVQLIFDEDLRDATSACVNIFGGAFAAFGEPRMAALCDMAFQLGRGGLRAFTHMIAAIQADDWEAAAIHALDSGWAKQTPARAQMNAEILRSGEWPNGNSPHT